MKPLLHIVEWGGAVYWIIILGRVWEDSTHQNRWRSNLYWWEDGWFPALLAFPLVWPLLSGMFSRMCGTDGMDRQKRFGLFALWAFGLVAAFAFNDRRYGNTTAFGIVVPVATWLLLIFLWLGWTKNATAPVPLVGWFRSFSTDSPGPRQTDALTR